MASEKISQLPVTTELESTDVMPLVQGIGGTPETVRVSLSQIKAFVLEDVNGLEFVAKTSNFTIPVDDLIAFPEKVYTNEGAGGPITFFLPAAVSGLRVNFYIATAQTLTVDANGTDTIRNSTVITGAGGTMFAGDIGFILSLWATATGKWATNKIIGNWSYT